MSSLDRMSSSELKDYHKLLDEKVATLDSLKHLTNEEERRLRDLKKTKLLVKEAIGRKEKNESKTTR
jgi:hypothetical protein